MKSSIETALRNQPLCQALPHPSHLTPLASAAVEQTHISSLLPSILFAIIAAARLQTLAPPSPPTTVYPSVAAAPRLQCSPPSPAVFPVSSTPPPPDSPPPEAFPKHQQSWDSPRPSSARAAAQAQRSAITSPLSTPASSRTPPSPTTRAASTCLPSPPLFLAGIDSPDPSFHARVEQGSHNARPATKTESNG